MTEYDVDRCYYINSSEYFHIFVATSLVCWLAYILLACSLRLAYAWPNHLADFRNVYLCLDVGDHRARLPNPALEGNGTDTDCAGCR